MCNEEVCPALEVARVDAMKALDTLDGSAGIVAADMGRRARLNE